MTDATQFTAPTIPQDGANLYVRLYQEVDQRWQFTDYLFTEPGAITPAELTTPTTNPLGTTDVQFEWTPGAGPQMYELWLGTSGPGSDELYHSGPTRATSVTVPSIPANGVKVYARFLQRINLLWQYTDAVYTESGSPTPAVLTSPTPGASTILGTTNVQFQWTQEGGSTLYEFRLGTTPCSYNLYISGGTKETSATAPTIPARSATVYACLLLLIDEEWQHTVYTYTELSPPSP